MKKSIVTIALVLCCIPMVFGSIITNTNQSAVYLRHLSRNASTDIDAVYYNPAGTTKLSDGFHIALHNQSLFQEKTVINEFPNLNNDTYIGEVNVPIFPNFYAVYKTNKLAVSFGFGPNAGGGSADFATGLPSFETKISTLTTLLALAGVSEYLVDIAFNGSSVYYGFQLNAAYEFADFISAGVGFRYIMASNTYEGHIKNIQVNPGGMWMAADAFLTMIGQAALASQLGDKAVEVKQTGTGFTPILSLHFNPLEQLHIGALYEFNTKLELENETTQDDVGMFPDGAKIPSDIPGIFSLGAEYALMPGLRLAFSYSLFLEKSADWGGDEDLVNKNSYNISAGIEFDVSKSITVSGGYLINKVDVSDAYQTDFSHEISGSTIGAGMKISLGRLDVDLAGLIIMYDKDVQKDILYDYTADLGINFGTHTESYERATWGFAIGLNYHITK